MGCVSDWLQHRLFGVWGGVQLLRSFVVPFFSWLLGLTHSNHLTFPPNDVTRHPTPSDYKHTLVLKPLQSVLGH